ncbi:MAG: DsbA family protein [Propionibacteriaceae bacterium]
MSTQTNERPENSPETLTTGPKRNTTALPWALVAVLAALSLVLGTLLFVKTDELNKARSQAVATPGTTATVGDGPAQVKAQPTTGDKAATMLKLAHRTPNDPLALGRTDAPIVLVEWADYRCPFCAKWSLEALEQLQPYVDSGSLRIEFRDFTIFGDQSVAAAAAARAAGNQGKYWEYAHAMWEIHTGQGHPDVTDEIIIDLAKHVGISDLDKFNADRTSANIRQQIVADTTEAKELGLNSTPFFLINTTPISGALPAAQFINVIEQYGGKK